MAVAGVLPYVHAFDQGHAPLFKREARLSRKIELKWTPMNLQVDHLHLFVCITPCFSLGCI